MQATLPDTTWFAHVGRVDVLQVVHFLITSSFVYDVLRAIFTQKNIRVPKAGLEVSSRSHNLLIAGEIRRLGSSPAWELGYFSE